MINEKIARTVEKIAFDCIKKVMQNIRSCEKGNEEITLIVSAWS